MEESSPPHIVIVGGGIGGLTAARDLAVGGARVTLLEASSVLGGKVARHTVAGVQLDAGAESFATRRDLVRSFADGLGLGDEHCRARNGSPLHDYWVFAPDTSGVRIAPPAPPPPAAPLITTEANAAAMAGVPFSLPLSFSGGAPTEVMIANGPSWLALDARTLTGTPPAAGTATVTITASNAGGSTSVLLTIAIAAAPPASPPPSPPPVTSPHSLA